MESESREQKRRNDIILIIVLLAASFFLLMMQNIFSKDGAKAVVLWDGEILSVISLEDELYGDDSLRIETTDGYNILEVKNGAASITCADCPDGLCVKQKAISKQGESLICLPHKLVIVVDDAEDNDIDTIAY